MLFTILYIVMSVNRFDTKLWLLINSLLDFFVQLKEKKCANIYICFRFSGSVVYGKQLRQIYNHDIYFSVYSYICYFSRFD